MKPNSPYLEIKPASVGGLVKVPGSKSYTNRALVAASLARGESTLRNALQSEDTELMVAALQDLDFSVQADWGKRVLKVQGSRGRIGVSEAEIQGGNAGTVVRFLAPLLTLGTGSYRITGSERMRQRPIQDLLDALGNLGVDAVSEAGNGCPPVRLKAKGLAGGHVAIAGSASSQFLSGLLLSAPCAKGELDIEVRGDLASKPYVDMTLGLMKDFGATVKRDGYKSFKVSATGYEGRIYDIEPDASAATFFLAAPLIAGGSLTVATAPAGTLQADALFLKTLQDMGARTQVTPQGIRVEGGGLKGIEADLNAFSDSVPTLAVLACFAQGPTKIRNVALIRRKESDRIGDLARELRKVGVRVEEFPDGLTIHPGPLHGAVLDTYNDHRLAMAFSLIGLKVPGIRIQNPGCVAKTYPDFFKDLETVSTR